MKKNKFFYIAIITLIFIFTLFLRWDYIGTLSDGHHQFDTAQTKIYVENWFYEGLLKNNFLSLWIPDSINYNSFNERRAYISYPVGPYLLIYIVKLIFNNTDTLKLIHLLSASIHYIIIILIFLFLSNLRFDLNKQVINSFSTLSALSYLFFPYAFYYHLMLFNFDTFIILPFIGIIFFEYLIRSEFKKIYFYTQSLLLFFSGFFDYLPVMLASSIFLFRIISPIKERNYLFSFIQIFVPLSFPYLIHVFHLIYNDFFFQLLSRFFTRTGLYSSINSEPAYQSFIYDFLVKKLNIYLPIVILCSFFLFKMFKKYKNEKPIYLCILIGFLSSITYSIILRNYAAIHDFSALKFFPMISITLFFLIPLCFLESLKKNKTNVIKYKILFKKFININEKSIMPIFICLMLGLIIADNTLRYFWVSRNENSYYENNKNIFPKIILFSQFPKIGIKDELISKIIRENSTYYDVFLSFTEFEIKRNPPQKLSFSRKIVTRIKDINEYIDIINSLPQNTNLKIILEIKNNCVILFQDEKKIFFENKMIIAIEEKNDKRVEKCL